MTTYSNRGQNSGISAYEINNDSIIVQFSTGSEYLYTYASAGVANIEKMKDPVELEKAWQRPLQEFRQESQDFYLYK